MTETKLARVEDLGDRLVVVNANAARRNALSPDLYAAIGGALDLAGREARVRSVILTGEGGFFCAGGDLNSLRERRALGLRERRAQVEGLHDLIRGIRACPRPVIAAVEGGAAGAGVSLALACDLLVAAEGARFTVAYVKAGLTPDGGLTTSLLRLLPRTMAAEMCLFGDPVPAERLHAMGVVNRLCPPGEAMRAAHELADRTAAGPPLAMARIKTLIASASEADTAAQLDREADGIAEAIGGDEAGEGIAAFLAKRPPDFTRPPGEGG